MMTMLIKRGFLILLLTFFAFITYSQEKDFGIWYNISAEHKLLDKLELDLSTTLRTFDNASKVEEIFFEGGLTYKLNKFLSIGGAYRITENYEDDDSYHLRHKWYADLKGSVEAGDFDFSGHFRFQRRYKTYFEDEEDKIPDMHGRYRIKAVYKTPSFPVNPYISTEIFCPLNKDPERIVDKFRYMGGIEYKISKKHVIEAKYIYQRDYFPKLRDENIISVDYNFKF